MRRKICRTAALLTTVVVFFSSLTEGIRISPHSAGITELRDDTILKKDSLEQDQHKHTVSRNGNAGENNEVSVTEKTQGDSRQFLSLPDEPSFINVGSLIGGRRSAAADVEITKETIESMVNCDFYIQNAGTCHPEASFSPCRFCRANSWKVVGTPQCPDEQSFVPIAQGKYIWSLKPIRKKSTLKNTYICVVESAAFAGHDMGGAMGMNNPGMMLGQQTPGGFPLDPSTNENVRNWPLPLLVGVAAAAILASCALGGLLWWFIARTVEKWKKPVEHIPLDPDDVYSNRDYGRVYGYY